MTFEANLGVLNGAAERIIPEIRRGIEKESLRITGNGHLSQEPHPQELGSALTHPFITTDYSEALIELVTPTFTSVEHALRNLEEVHRVTYHHLGDELLWVNSLPCLLGDESSIPIAQFGNSNIGRMKNVYRRGLDVRYGRRMQIIAGIHYNFSVPAAFWEAFGLYEKNDHAISNAYMAAIRNFHRHCWLIFYLFGASPAACGSFFDKVEDRQNLSELGSHTLYGAHATSLRMSNYGYRNPVQSKIRIDHNTINAYIETLSKTINEPFPPYVEIGVKKDGEHLQLNSNLLQIENEYYSVIRPKRRTESLESPTHALRNRGVEYLEVRCVDLDPNEPIGLSACQGRFLDLFLMNCLLSPSPPISGDDSETIAANKDYAVFYGRNTGQTLRKNGQLVTLTSWGNELLDQLEAIAEIFDQALVGDHYRRAVRDQRLKIENPESTPSARIVQELVANNEPFFAFAMQKAEEAKAALIAKPIAQLILKSYDNIALESIEKQKEIEQSDVVDFDTFLDEYFGR